MKRMIFVLLACACLLTGCRKTPEQASAFAMDTMMSFTFYGDRQAVGTARDRMTQRLAGLDRLLSVTEEDSAVSRINQSGGQPVEVDGDTARLLALSLELCRATGGALDVTAYPAVKAWGFTAGEHRVPPPAELEGLAASIDYTLVRLDGHTVTLPAGMELDLGAVAKGYAGDLLAEIAGDSGVSSALLNLGQSTIVAVGSKPGGKPWRVAIQDPAGEGRVGVVELSGCAMGTSGGYQRFFERDGAVYWHILDPETAAPARSGLASVTVVSPSALTCDGLSTALFVMGLEEGTQFWRSHPELEFEAVFVAEDGGLYCTAGLAERFVPENREVTILE